MREQNLFMALQFTTSYIEDAKSLFRYYKKLGDRAIEQCPDAGLLALLDPESNSIATIVKHISGNMLLRWTDFLTSDGEKPFRDRDAEFDAPPQTRAELLDMWERGWNCLFAALDPLTESDMTRTITIRTEPHSVIQAVNRQVAHYSYHIGQIVFLARHFAGPKWQSLTIPKKQSAQFTAKVASGELSQR